MLNKNTLVEKFKNLSEICEYVLYNENELLGVYYEHVWLKRCK